MATNATSFTSPLADKFAAVSLPPQVDYVIEKVASAGILTWFFTLLALAVVYDQSTYFSQHCAIGVWRRENTLC